MIRLILIFVLFANNALACSEDVQIIEKGQTANCTGFLFSPIAAKKADEAADDRDYYKKLSEKLEQRQKLQDERSKVLDKRLQLYMEQSHILSEKLTERENRSEWEKVLYFSLGVVVTGVAVYGAGRL